MRIVLAMVVAFSVCDERTETSVGDHRHIAELRLGNVELGVGAELVRVHHQTQIKGRSGMDPVPEIVGAHDRWLPRPTVTATRGGDEVTVRLDERNPDAWWRVDRPVRDKEQADQMLANLTIEHCTHGSWLAFRLRAQNPSFDSKWRGVRVYEDEVVHTHLRVETDECSEALGIRP